ncbi:MAG: PBP1A family penicillin-binding protein [Dethiobacteria bacterium]|jgi:penicillin-binding protein 1A
MPGKRQLNRIRNSSGQMMRSGTGGGSLPPKKKRRKFKFWKAAFLLLMVFFVLFCVGVLTIVFSYVMGAPGFNKGVLQPPVTSYIYDRQGKEITRLYDEQNRIEIPLEQIPEHVQKAFIAIEDERFEKHFGVDPLAILRAFVSNLRRRTWTGQGGSTITQQVVKNAFLTQEKTFARKIQEAWLAIKMERQYSKDEILEIYLNQCYFAHGAYGVETAANIYFGKSASELTIAEGALLAGVPRSPNYYSPYMNFESSRQRQSLVLSKMYELGYINHQEMIDAKEEEIILSELSSREHPYPHFVDYVLHHELVNILVSLPQYKTREEAYEAIYNAGLKVYTTLDTNAQATTEEILNNESLYPQNIRVDMALMKQLMQDKNYNGYPQEVFSAEGILQPQAGAVVANPDTGEIFALVGGREYGKNNQDLRFLSRRLPGSAIKPIVAYAPAMEEKMITPGAIVDDAPFIRGNWAPENFDSRFWGLMTVREALVWSRNVPAVRVFEQITPQIGLEYAKKMGLSTLEANDYNLAAALGGLTHGVTLLDMAEAYSVLANQGIKVNLYTVKRIADRDGNILYEHHSKPESILSEQTAFLLTDVLKDVVRRGTAGRLRAGRPVAAKTGTTNNNRDAYLVAYTPDLVVSFWIGHDIAKLGNVRGGSGTTITYMQALLSRLLKDVSPSDFTRPAGISGPISICTKSGLRPGPFCPPEAIANEIFPTSLVPQGTCQMHLELEICKSSGLLASEYCPESEKETKVFLNRPAFELTDGRWKGGAGRGPEDAALLPPTEYCEVHTTSSAAPSSGGLVAELLEEPLRVHLWWDYHPDIVEYEIYKYIEGKGEKTLLQKLPGDARRYLDYDLEADEVYIYTLVTMDKEGVKSELDKWVVSTFREEKEDNGNEDENNNDDGNDDDHRHGRGGTGGPNGEDHLPEFEP